MRTAITTAAFVLAISIIYAAAVVRAQVVQVTAQTCADLVRYRPAPDVAYKPGVDAEGRPVAPADLGGGVSIALPKTFEIPITVDLQRLLGIPADPALFQTDQFRVGTVTYADGRAYFNGQQLQDEAATELSDLCQRRLGVTKP